MKLYKALIIAMLLITTLAFPWGSELCQGCRIDSSALAGPIYTWPNSTMLQQMISTNGTFLFQDDVNLYPQYSNGVKLEIRTQNKSPLRLAYNVNNYVDFSVSASGGLTINATGGVVVSSNGNLIIRNGNVGIGTTSPGAKLEIYDSIQIENPLGLLYLNKNWATNHPIAVFKQTGFGGNTDTSQGLVIDITGMATGRAFEIKNNAVNNVTVLNNGNVGIGTTTPSERLEVNGIIRATPIVGQWVHTVMQYPTSDSTNDAIILFGTEELNTSSEYYQLESNGSGVTIKKAGIYYIVGTTDSLTNTYTGRADLHLHTGTNHLMTIIYQIRSAGADTYNHYTIDTVANIAANSKISLGWSTQTLVSWFMHSSLSHLRIMRLN